MARSPLRKANQPRPPAKPVATPQLAVDEASLAARKQARSTLDLDNLPLCFTRTAAGKTFTRDYRDRPAGETLLIRQLLAGAELVLRGRETSFTTVQDIYYGVDEFLEFAALCRYSSSSIRCLADIGVQTAKDWEAWYLSVHPGRTVNRKRYGKIRDVVSKVKKAFSEDPNVGPDFKWPSGPRTTDRPVESYSAGVFNSLSAAALADIKYVMSEWDRRERTRNSTPIVSYPTPSIADACLAILYVEEGYVERGRPPRFLSDRRRRIANLAIAMRVAKHFELTIDEFVDLYLDSGQELSRSGVLFPTYKVNEDRLFSGMSAQESWDIATRTTEEYYPEWPLGMDVADADFLLSIARFCRGRKGNGAAESANYKVLQSMRFGPMDNPFSVGLDAYFSRTFFTTDTLYPFYLYVQLNTGWNEEVVGALSSNLELHVQSDIIDPDYVLIWGWKGRVDLPVSHRSSRTAPYSVYNILKFVARVLDGQKNTKGQLSDSLWQYVRSKNLWVKYNRCVSQIGSGNSGAMSASFVKRHAIDLGTSFKKEQRIDSRRLRTTCETRRRESGLSIDEVCTLMGHAEIDTTDSSYDSDGAAIELKNRRIRGLQEEFVSDFRDYKARLVSSVTLQQLRSSMEAAGGGRRDRTPRAPHGQAGLSQPEVVHLLSPAGQTYIVACVNRTAPSWPNAEQFVPVGSTCTFFNRCCLCDKAVIFEEALPYIARRLMDLERLRREQTIGDWMRNYGQESHAWQAILDDWNDREAVASAQRQCLKSKYVLPLTMRGAQ